MFGSLGIFQAMVQALQGVMGTATDTASLTTSLHAKLNYLWANLQKAQGPASAPGSFSTASGTYVTALSVTGRGKLLAVGFYTSTTIDSSTTYIKITVDGYVIFEGNGNGTGTNNTNNMIMPGPAAPIGGTLLERISGYGNGNNLVLDFKTSLLIEVKNNTAYTTTVRWLYETN